MAIDPEFLRILVCPRTRKPLREANTGELKTVNDRISQGKAVNYAGQSVSEQVEEGLVPEGEPVLYPIQEGIPVLLVDEAIGLNDAAPTAAPPSTSTSTPTTGPTAPESGS